MTTLTLLTDFGTADYYVAAMKGVLRRLAPDAALVDVSHDVPAGDVAAAAFLLTAAARWFPAGSVHLAVVDPGVGSVRRILALRAGAAWLVAPDNGLLTPFFDGTPACWQEAAAESDAEGGDLELRQVDATDLFLRGPGATFHGRDRFAPVAAYLARGEEFAALGPLVDDPVRLALETPTCEGEPPVAGAAGAVLRGRVVHVDRFGNLVTDVPTAWLGGAACRAEVEGRATDLWVSHYEELPTDRPGVLAGSLGTLELSVNGDSLAERWDLGRGARVTVRVASHSRG
jgi:hypothetical protein